MLHVIEETLLDTVKLIPFLFLTYLAMEYLEHRAGNKISTLIKKAGRLGPLAGGALGMLPQCGFSAAASGLYAGRIITLGTLLAVYLSTSDEMLPILISEQVPVSTILKLVLLKAAAGMLTGMAIDLIFRKRADGNHNHIHDICESEHCHCEKGILTSALSHTAKISFFILVITFALNLLLHFTGENILANLLMDRPVLGPVLAGIVGLIPNCAGSVVITQLYLEGTMGLGSAMAGLLTGTGVGLLVLFRVNRDRKDSLKVLGLLYFTGVLAGIVIGQGRI